MSARFFYRSIFIYLGHAFPVIVTSLWMRIVNVNLPGMTDEPVILI
jgi:hypothetical protein